MRTDQGVSGHAAVDSGPGVKDVLGWIALALGVVAIPTTVFLLWGVLAGLAGAIVGIVAIARKSSPIAGVIGLVASGVAVLWGAAQIGSILWIALSFQSL